MIATARSWIGTPWRHQARLPGVAMDCVGAVVCSARAAGLDVPDSTDYSEDTSGSELLELVSSVCARVDRERAGDLLVFRVGSRLWHVGIATGEGTMLHSRRTLSGGSLREEEIDGGWRARLHSVWRYRAWQS